MLLLLLILLQPLSIVWTVWCLTALWEKMIRQSLLTKYFLHLVFVWFLWFFSLQSRDMLSLSDLRSFQDPFVKWDCMLLVCLFYLPWRIATAHFWNSARFLGIKKASLEWRCEGHVGPPFTFCLDIKVFAGEMLWGYFFKKLWAIIWYLCVFSLSVGRHWECAIVYTL